MPLSNRPIQVDMESFLSFHGSVAFSGFLILTSSSLENGQQVHSILKANALGTRETDSTSVTLSGVGFNRRRSAWRLFAPMTWIVSHRVHP
ncbi:MAG: hypothetical protein QF560_15640 [SAR324 cluster bacterium]|nr:hypothetical protein [Deltaproteobacteria bacterium]MDP6090653.1 hypothetical protein [SAR324 cluster bacterium]MDP6247529.1 hypothetical protein [SAR324 cluster bacterium]MDP6462615.1 hypothetical protein [SAR324 cluster bacterium]MDP6638964.1 hypothetical protein [SAR324 cluster bacterium]